MSNVFSPAQLRASLWAKQSAHVHAVIDGLVVPGIATMLRSADVGGWECLQRGALSAEAEKRAAYLVELKESSPFTDWLFKDATQAFPGWGVVTISDRSMLVMREHCRSIGEIITPDGERRPWRWFDPDVLRLVLPTFLGGQLDEFFAVGQTVVLPEPGAWTWMGMDRGVLATESRALMAEAA